MVKKLLCTILALLCILSFTVIGVSAQADTNIYFEVPDQWEHYNYVYCHIGEYGEYPFSDWQSKIERCTKVEEGLYSFDVSKVCTLEEGKYYNVIFCVDIGYQTHDTLMTSDCYGDTLFCDGTRYECINDDSRMLPAAFWKNQNESVLGPILYLTGSGRFVGTCLPPDKTSEEYLTDFIYYYLDDAREHRNMSDQELIDDAALYLGLTTDEVSEIIDYVGITIEWDKNYKKPSSSDEASIDEYEVGDVNTDGKLSVRDATLVQKYLAKITMLNDDKIMLADYDYNGNINIKDATAIQKKLAKII